MFRAMVVAFDEVVQETMEPNESKLVFRIGDRVVKNPAAWRPNALDAWGRGEGVGVVVEPPFAIDDLELVDVRWPAGRCMEAIEGLQLASSDRSTAAGDSTANPIER
ncbi:MAG: hypothetical protein ACKN81_18945, partial [Pirellulaceae bacterium]